MKVYLDLDGVLYAWNKGVCQLFNIDYNNREFQNKLKNDYFGVENYISTEKVSQAILEAGQDFWMNLELFPWAHDLYSSVIQLAGEENVYFCTSFGKWPDGAAAKSRKLTRDFKSQRLVLIKDKHLLSRFPTFLIDDKPENIELFEKNGQGWGWLWPNAFKFHLRELNPSEEIDRMVRHLTVLRQAYIHD